MKKIVFTDLDGTLTLRGTYKQFLMRNLKTSLVLKHSFSLSKILLLYALGRAHHDDVQTITFKIFFDGYDTKKPLKDFLDKIVWNTKVRDLVDAKKSEGYRIVVVSASPDVYIKDVCNYLGYDDYISTNVAYKGEYLNGEFIDGMCNFEEKKKRIQAYLGEEKPAHTISYGNSSGDFAMMSFCDEAYFVTGTHVERWNKKEES